MPKTKQKIASLFEELKEGLDAAIQFEQGKRARGARVSTVTVTPVRKRSPAQIKKFSR